MTPRDKRTAAIGIAVVVALFAGARGVPALVAWQRRKLAEAADVTVRAASARVGRRLLPVVQESLQARGIRLTALDSVLLTAASAPAAAANLASLLDDLADDAKLKISAVQLRSDSTVRGSLTEVGVRVTGVTDASGLAAFLRAVEGGDTPLTVRELLVSQAEPAAAANRVEALRVEVLVEGVARLTAHAKP